MIAKLAIFCRYSRFALRGVAVLAALAVLGLFSGEAKAGMVLPAELAAPSNDNDCLAPDDADDDSTDQDAAPQRTTPSLADQQASTPSGASGTGTSLNSGGSTLALIMLERVSAGSLAPTGACLERANAALPTPPTFDFLRPPCRLA